MACSAGSDNAERCKRNARGEFGECPPSLERCYSFFRSSYGGTAFDVSRMMACPAAAQEHKIVIALLSEGWWTRSQRIRTEGAIPFEVAIVDPPEVPTYIGIAEKALHLKELKMNPNQIAVALKVDRTTVLRALRWVKSIPVYATGPNLES